MSLSHDPRVPHDGRMDDIPAATTATTSWLDLLSAEASVRDLENHRRQVLAAAPADEHGAIHAQADRALEIQARLAERKRHGAELTVLNDLARRLASLRDSGEVLQEVAHQARRLLGVDIAYIMLLQPDDVLRIEVVDGTLGSIMRGIELVSGTGLGGEVRRTGRPVWSEDYLHDAELRHATNVDHAASSEQLGGILGVPLLMGEETIGVLLAAERHPRSFTGREIELLAALAAHAAVAITNARIFEQSRATADELAQANSILQQTNDTRQRAIELRESLTHVVIRGGGFAEVAAEIGRAIGADVTVLGAQDEHVCGPPVTATWSARATVGDTPGSSPQRIDLDGASVAVVPIHLRSGYVGSLVAAASAPWDEEAIRLLTIGATSVALLVASERSVAEAELRTRGEFVNALLSPDAEEASIRRRARSTGIDIDAVSVVAVLDAGAAEPREAAQLAARLAAELGGWSADHADHVVVLLPGVTAAETKQRIARLGDDDGLPCAVGVAPCTGGSRQVRASHEIARQTATVLHALGRPGECVEASELGVYRSLFSQAGRDEIATFVELTIGPLLSHDAERQRDLVRTLSVYLEQSQHHARTCGILHIHANTLYQRLDRVTQLLGPQWKDPGRGLDVQLALRLNGLVQQVHRSRSAS
jgi:GAF domain-containing protein